MAKPMPLFTGLFVLRRGSEPSLGDGAGHTQTVTPALGPRSSLFRFTSLAEFSPCFDISQLT